MFVLHNKKGWVSSPCMHAEERWKNKEKNKQWTNDGKILLSEGKGVNLSSYVDIVIGGAYFDDW